MKLPSKKDSDEPPSLIKTPWLVAVIANVLNPKHASRCGPSDAQAEWDKPETIRHIRDAIETDGHRTVFLNADVDLPRALRRLRPDICFNIAESSGNDSREAHVPALLALMGIPYTASRVLANAISLDKALTKRIWRSVGLPTTPHQIFETGDESLRKTMKFPLFVKPVMEGTGMGVRMEARVTNKKELREQVRWVIQTYKEAALVETFLPGREFTVGVLGRAAAHKYSRHPKLYEADGFHRFPVLEIESRRSITPGIYGHAAKAKPIDEEGAPGYLCPAVLEEKLARRLQNLARKAHAAIGAEDVSRVDIRIGEDDKPYLLEINTLPGLNPAISDLCIMSDAEKLPYRDLILEILYLGASRYGMVQC